MRTHFCGLVDEAMTGQTVTLCGWTDVARNLGGVCFIDLRDHEGIVQVTVDPSNAEVFKVAASLGYEDVLQVEGIVRAREAVNTKIRTGQVEVIATKITVLNKAEPLPFHHHENPGEETRLKYRYLDLRHPEMQRRMRTRTKLVSALRHWLDDKGFQSLLKEVLNASSDEFTAVRARIDDRLGEASVRLGKARVAAGRRMGEAADITQEYVVHNPWKALGAAAAVGLIIGTMLRSR